MAKDYLIETISEESLKQISELVKRIESGIEGVIKMNKEFKNLKLPSDISKGFTAVTEETKKSNKVVSDALKLQIKLENSEKARMQAMSSTNRQIIKNREETKRLNKETRDNARLTSQSSGAYERLRIKLAQAEKEYLDLGASQKASNAQMKTAQTRVLKLRGLSDKLNNSIKRGYDDVGRYGKVWGKFGGILRGAVGVFGLYQGIQFAKSVYEDIKAIDAMNKSLKQITETQSAYNKAKKFTQEVSEESGVDILETTKAYTKFTAAAKTTNLTLDQTQNIFRQTAKAGAVLGLSQDDINGSFKALEQILSKGKVQAEEIRGQLGERLPGAFQILAKSMGLTTAELSKQLELGNVISDEVLPKFAEELERTYSLDKIDKVRTLTSEQTRLGNEWLLLVESFENGEGKVTKALVSIMEALGGVLQMIREANKELAPELESAAYDSQIERYKKLGEEAKTYARIERDRSLSLINDLSAEKKALEEKTTKFKENNNLFERITSTEYIANDKALDRIKKINNALSTQKGIVKAANQTLSGYKPPIKDQEEFGKQIDLTRGKLEKVTFVYQNVIDKLKEIKDANFEAFVRGTVSHEQYVQSAKDVDNAINDIYESLKLTDGAMFEDVDVSGLEKYQALKEKQNKDTEDAIEATRRQAEEVEILTEAFGNLESTLGIQQGTFQTIFEQIGNGFEDAGLAAEAFGELASGAFANIMQASNVRLENEARNLEIEKDTALQFAGDSAAAREEIERRYDERQKAIKEKQAKNDKAKALFDIAISTAVGIIQAAPNVALMAIIGALGFAQAAVVAATPIPQFKDGVRDFSGGQAILGDGGVSEYVRTPDNKVFRTPATDTLYNLPKGTDVYKNAEEFNQSLNGILGDVGINPLGNAVYGKGVNPVPLVINQSGGGITKDEMERVMQKTLAKQAKSTTVMDKNGFKTYISKGHSRREILNNQVTFNAQSV